MTEKRERREFALWPPRTYGPSLNMITTYSNSATIRLDCIVIYLACVMLENTFFLLNSDSFPSPIPYVHSRPCEDDEKRKKERASGNVPDLCFRDVNKLLNILAVLVRLNLLLGSFFLPFFCYRVIGLLYNQQRATCCTHILLVDWTGLD